MPLFPVLDLESVVQEKDKTRLIATASYASGTDSISAVEIKPGKVADYLDVTENRYLDWSFKHEIEIDETNNKIDFVEGVTVVDATIPNGTYTLTELAAAIVAAMNDVGIDLTYTCALDSATNKFTISADGVFNLLPVSGANSETTLLPEIGFLEDVTAEESYEGEKVEVINVPVTLRLLTGFKTQTIGFSGTATTGSISFVHNGVETSQSADFNTDAAQMQTVLRTIPALAEVVVTGNRLDGFLVSHIPDNYPITTGTNSLTDGGEG